VAADGNVYDTAERGLLSALMRVCLDDANFAIIRAGRRPGG